MGMYTELNCAFRLKADVPQLIVEALRVMIDGGSADELPCHPFFRLRNWCGMLRGEVCSFDGDIGTSMRFDGNIACFRVTIRCILKNYEGEIEQFIDWITPYIDSYPDWFLGYSRYEDRDLPTLLFYPNQWRQVVLPVPLSGDGHGSNPPNPGGGTGYS